MNRGGSERNQIRVAAHEADATAVLHHLNDVAGDQRAFAVRACRPVQHGAAVELSAAVDQAKAVPQRLSRSFPKLNAWTFAHDPFAVGSVQEYLRIETFAPFDHR